VISFRILRIESSKEQHLFETEIFRNLSPFDQCNASSLKVFISFQNKKRIGSHFRSG